MTESKARKIATLLDNSGDVKAVALDNVSNAPGVVGVQVYPNPSALPTTNLSSGDQAFVTSNQRLYITNGSGWYNVALINSTPTFTTGPASSYTLSNDLSATVITLVAQDSDGQAVTYSATDSGMAGIASVSQDSSVFTVTPLTDSGSGGTFTLTFQATDGIGLVSALSTFTLSFGPDWTGTPTETKFNASDIAASSHFGEMVEISSDGNYAIVGSPRQDTGGTDTGAVYIYVRSGSSWSQQVKLQASDRTANYRFGTDVSLSDDGTYAIIGSHYGNGGHGSAYVFIRSGTSWSQQAILTASDSVNGARYGESVSISSDGTYVIVGAPYDTPSSLSNAGSSYVYIRSGTSWTQQAKLVTSDIQGGDTAGFHVTISGDGNYAMMGARNEDTGGYNAGAAYVFIRSGTSWSQQAKLVSSDLQASDAFGSGVSLSSNGTYAIIGAYASYSSEDPWVDEGSAYIFIRSGTSWSQQAKLIATDGQAGDDFGWNVDISNDGSHAIVGAPEEDAGGTNAGAAYVFKRSGTSWSQVKKLQSSDLQAFDRYGRDVALSNDGTFGIVGAYQERGGSGDPYSSGGAVYIYEA
jgi:hypothetical protein